MSRMLVGSSKLFLLLLISCLISSVGCKVTEREIIYSSFAEVPEEAKGAIKIGQTAEIQVTIEGDEEIVTMMNLAGFYAIRGHDLKEFVRVYRLYQEIVAAEKALEEKDGD